MWNFEQQKVLDAFTPDKDHKTLVKFDGIQLADASQGAFVVITQVGVRPGPDQATTTPEELVEAVLPANEPLCSYRDDRTFRYARKGAPAFDRNFYVVNVVGTVLASTVSQTISP